MYWSLMHLCSDRLRPGGISYSAEVWHRYFASRFLGCDETLLPGGKKIVEPHSTSDLSTDEFGEYFDKVQAFCAERDVYLADIEAA